MIFKKILKNKSFLVYGLSLTGLSVVKFLKKSYAKGIEISGKTLGIIGFGRIGQEVAKKAIGLGMNVLAHDKFVKEAKININFFNGDNISFKVFTKDLE